MIDTSKYEGHTEGPWVWDGTILTNHEAIHWHYGTKGVDIVDICGTMSMTQEPDLRLVADAPLLLEEVLRLQRELDTQYEYIEWLEEFAPKAGDYNTAWDAYELAKGIHWTQKEEEE